MYLPKRRPSKMKGMHALRVCSSTILKDNGSGETDRSPLVLFLPYCESAVVHGLRPKRQLRGCWYATIVNGEIWDSCALVMDWRLIAVSHRRVQSPTLRFGTSVTSQHTGRLRSRRRRRDSKPVECASETSWSARNLSQITARARDRAEHRRSDLRHGSKAPLPAVGHSTEPLSSPRNALRGARSGNGEKMKHAGHYWRRPLGGCTLQRRLLRSRGCVQRQSNKYDSSSERARQVGRTKGTRFRSMQVISGLHRLTVTVAQSPGRRARHDDSLSRCGRGAAREASQVPGRADEAWELRWFSAQSTGESVIA